MNREQVVTYLKFSGFSDEQIEAIEGAFTCDKCVYSTSEGCQYDDITETIPPFETSDDAIRRQAVLDSIHANCVYENEYNLTAKHIEDAVKQLPSVTPQPKAGHWIKKEGREQGYDIAGIKTWYIQIMCDKCGFIKTAIEGRTGQYHFCPNCGSKMESEET